jgi:predicted HTH domain antitoxin
MATPNGQNIRTIEIEFPAELLNELSGEQVRRLAREAFYVRLYEQGRISSGRAGALLGISRSDFLDLLGQYGVSYFDEETDLAADARNASQAHE